MEKEMATHSSVLAWRIPGTGEPGGLPVYGVAQSWTWLKWLSLLSLVQFCAKLYALNYKELSEIRKNRGAEDIREDFMQDIEGKMKIEMDGGMEGGMGE